jgi:hypothetical protein
MDKNRVNTKFCYQTLFVNLIIFLLISIFAINAWSLLKLRHELDVKEKQLKDDLKEFVHFKKNIIHYKEQIKYVRYDYSGLRYLFGETFDYEDTQRRIRKYAKMHNIDILDMTFPKKDGVNNNSDHQSFHLQVMGDYSNLYDFLASIYTPIFFDQRYYNVIYDCDSETEKTCFPAPTLLPNLNNKCEAKMLCYTQNNPIILNKISIINNYPKKKFSLNIEAEIYRYIEDKHQ